jgi:hypothetical protein
MSEIVVIHMRDAIVGDRGQAFGVFDESTQYEVAAVDQAAKEITARGDDGLVTKYPWDSKRSRGYNKIKVLR